MSEYEKNLSAIQWVTKSEKFSEHRLIQLGDAIASFYDCIKENEKLQKALDILRESNGRIKQASENMQSVRETELKVKEILGE